MDPPATKLVIFDCDGVLVDSERLAIKVDREVFAELGWVLTEAEIVERFVGASWPSIKAEVDTPPSKWALRLATAPSSKIAPAASQRLAPRE